MNDVLINLIITGFTVPAISFGCYMMVRLNI
jgi:hypothetical protein